MSKADFEKIVSRAQEYIKAGDIFQCVLSQRWETNLQDSSVSTLSGSTPRESVAIHVLPQD